MYNYNIFHRKNVNTQFRPIDENNYTYQTFIGIFKKLNRYKSKIRTVLDVGCGVGTIDFFIASKGISIHGIDVSSSAILLANKSKSIQKLSKVFFECADIDTYEITNHYDLVILSEVIEHVKTPHMVLKKISNSIEKDGILIVSTPLRTAPLYRWGMLDKFDKEVGHIRRYSVEELKLLIRKYNFEIVETRLVEGLLRNYLFTSKTFGKLLRFAKWPITIVINLIDSALINLFGPSNVYLVCKKI